MTPGLDWRAEYGPWPVACAKLAYCERTVGALRDRDPVVTDAELDEDVGEIEYSLDQYYRDDPAALGELPPGLDGALRAIFEDLGGSEVFSMKQTLARAAVHIRRCEHERIASVLRWTDQ